MPRNTLNNTTQDPIDVGGHTVNPGEEYTYYTGTIEQDKLDKIAQAKLMCSQNIYDLAPQFKQDNATLGIYTQEEKDEIIAIINHFRDECTALETSINACSTQAEVADIEIDYVPYS